MNQLFFYIRGYVRYRVTGADPGLVLNRLSKERIAFWDIIWLDEFTVIISVFLKSSRRLKEFVAKSMCEVAEETQIGLKEALKSFARRKILLIGVTASVILVLVLQNFILCYRVEGNTITPSEEIMQALDEIGIQVGIYGPDIKPKWVKNHVLNILPQLQWITITQNGSIANVVVRERPETPEPIDRRGFANVIASRAGLIIEQSVMEGQAVKHPGDFVSDGEMLVSGVVDLENRFMIVYAQAETLAKTWHKNTVVMPQYCMKKNNVQTQRLSVWLEIGNRQIKIFGNSGISNMSCDKMVSKKSLRLPGDIELPISIIHEQILDYHLTQSQIGQDEAEEILNGYADARVYHALSAGQVLTSNTGIVCENDRYTLSGVYECQEIISKTVAGKWNKEDYLND